MSVIFNIHRLKTLPEHFEPVLLGLKRAELRRNDRPFRVGDYLVLEEWNSVVGVYTGRKVAKPIVHIADVSAYLPGYVLISLA